MQDIVFYVAAKETLGKVRDYSNMRNSDAPLLTLGVAVCLRMRLFDDIEDSMPYPIASFSGIADWQWRMDADFDRSTACKLVADADGISVHTVTDTVKGETMSFTEFVIPISNMNTEELVAWLGSDKVKTGLAGELVGYDDEGHAMFVLQIEDFSVRNRLAGLNDEDEDDPTPVDQEIVTRPVAEQMIQTAVSAFDASKQDKLTSGNAGTGITISNAGVISADNVPQSAVTGLVSALSGKQNTLSAGFWMEIDDDWISVERYHTIKGPYSSGSVTLQPGEAYKIYATTTSVTLNKTNMPSNKWGTEGHAEIFVAATGYIHTGSGVVLANALEPDAVNNCTLRFHDDNVIISVEDHVAGYVVITASGTTAGTLPYALHNVSSEYIAFDATTNSSIIDLSGTTTYAGEKHVVGNGYTETILSGGINCTSKTTFANLGMNGVVVSSGTLTMGNVYIPNGATVAVSGGSLAVEKVTGDGTINLGGSNVFVSSGGTAYANGCHVVSGTNALRTSRGTIKLENCVFSGNATALNQTLGFITASSCIFVGNSSTQGGAVYAYYGSGVYSGCVFSANSASALGGAFQISDNTTTLVSCTFSDNVSPNYADALGITGTGKAIVSGCSFGPLQNIQLREHGNVTLVGSNLLAGRIATRGGMNDSDTVTISSGAVIDLTSSIAPGGGITVLTGGCTINGVSIPAGTYTRITSDSGQDVYIE